MMHNHDNILSLFCLLGEVQMKIKQNYNLKTCKYSFHLQIFW